MSEDAADLFHLSASYDLVSREDFRFLEAMLRVSRNDMPAIDSGVPNPHLKASVKSPDSHRAAEAVVESSPTTSALLE
jgi:hypothetical protein